MRQKFVKVLSLISISLIFSFTSSALSLADNNKTPLPVKITQKNPILTPHRTLEAAIEAFYLDGTITADFYGIDGIVTITIANTSTGEQIVEFVNASEGAALIDMYGMTLSGNFTISFLTSAGDLYSGTFSL